MWGLGGVEGYVCRYTGMPCPGTNLGNLDNEAGPGKVSHAHLRCVQSFASMAHQ